MGTRLGRVDRALDRVEYDSRPINERVLSVVALRCWPLVPNVDLLSVTRSIVSPHCVISFVSFYTCAAYPPYRAAR